MQNHLEISPTSRFVITFFSVTHLFKNRFLPPDNDFWSKNSVLQVSGRNTLENVIKITSKSKFPTHFVQIPYHLHPARQGAHPAWSNSLHGIHSGPWKIVFFRLLCHFLDVGFIFIFSGFISWFLGLTGRAWTIYNLNEVISIRKKSWPSDKTFNIPKKS